MLKQTRIILSLVIMTALLLSSPSCASNRDGTNSPVSDNKGEHLPPPAPVTGNPKLLYVLVQLIQAEKRGEAEAFARQSGGAIELRDGRVFVTIQCVPGQVEAATKAATSAGAKLGASARNSFDAFVPITSLEALASEKSVFFIATPDRFQPQGSN